MEKIKWGIIGTGVIARKFAEGLVVLPDAELAAVASRTEESVSSFGDTFNVPYRHGSYEALAQNPVVDVVYIATPHPMHYENSLLCLQAGKAVLCEKPFTLNAHEAQELIRVARAKKLFLMEAMWNRFTPAVARLRQLLAEGVIGEIKMITADLGFKFEHDPQNRLFNPHLGGGALLDIGVYPLAFTSMILGVPDRITSLALFGQTGVDEQASLTLAYQQGQLANLYFSFLADTPSEVIIMGSRGRIRVHAPIYRPDRLTITRFGQADELLHLPYEGNAYNYEAAEVMACLRTGQLESAVMPLDESLSIMQIMDRVRAEWGLKYPGEV